MQYNNKFPKSMRLYKKKEIEATINHGRKEFLYPLLVFYKDFADGKDLKFGLSVPKKRMKKAVDRNRCKRILREAFRQNNHLLKKKIKGGLHIFVVYQDHQTEDCQVIANKMVKIFESILEKQEKG